MKLDKHLEQVWEYINAPNFALSFSSMCALLDSNLDFYKYLRRYFYDESDLVEMEGEYDTDAILIGRAIDEYCFSRCHPLAESDWGFYIEEQKVKLNTVAGKNIRKESELYAQGKEILRQEHWQKVQIMYDSIKYHFAANNLIFDAATKVQGKIQFNDLGVNVRGIFDVCGNSELLDEYGNEIGNYVCDLKKMPNCDDRYLQFEVFKRRLHLQAYLYKTGIENNEWHSINACFLVIVEPSGHCNVKRFTGKQLLQGKELYQQAIDTFLELRLKNKPELLIKSYPPYKTGFSNL